tara:strand:- start:39 stop:359 length:321 start_codon:yes stop_codon:yes gene_type:complete
MSDAMTQEQQEFKEKYELFLAETQLSYAKAATVLDVGQNSLKEWFRVRDGKMRKPAKHIMRAVELKIDRLNELNYEIGIYAELHGMPPGDRAAYLQSKLRHYEATA